jgi:hypothetical protein
VAICDHPLGWRAAPFLDHRIVYRVPRHSSFGGSALRYVDADADVDVDVNLNLNLNLNATFEFDIDRR